MSTDPYQTALNFYSQEREVSALPYAKQAVQNRPDLVAGWILLSRLLNDDNEILAALEQALQRDPQNPIALGCKASALMRLGKLQEARVAYESALSIDPRCIDALIAKARYQLFSGQAESALPTLNEALAIEPTVALYRMKINLLLSFEKKGEAQTIALAAVMVFPNSAKLHADLASSFMMQKDYQGALKEAERAIAISDEESMAWAVKGWALGGLGQYGESVEAFDKAIALDPTDEGYKEGREESLKFRDRTKKRRWF